MADPKKKDMKKAIETLIELGIVEAAGKDPKTGAPKYRPTKMASKMTDADVFAYITGHYYGKVSSPQ
nr:hypothetical protein BdHM001_36190 [Bdellovibrio sp. HM001]